MNGVGSEGVLLIKQGLVKKSFKKKQGQKVKKRIVSPSCCFSPGKSQGKTFANDWGDYLWAGDEALET